MFAGGAEVGDGRFVHVPDVVELVAVFQFRPSLRSGGVLDVAGVDGAVRIEIPIGLLRRGDLHDQVVEVSIQRRIRMRCQGIGRGFNDLEHV